MTAATYNVPSPGGILPSVRRYAPDVSTTPPPPPDWAVAIGDATLAAIAARLAARVAHLRANPGPTIAPAPPRDRLTNVRPGRRHPARFRGARPAEHPLGGDILRRPPGVLTPLPHDHPDAILAALGRTDANGYRWEAVTRHHDDGRISVRYVAPLRIGGAGILRPDGEGPILRGEYRRRDRAAIVARDVMLSARRQAWIAADTLVRVAERVTHGDGPDHFPALTRTPRDGSEAARREWIAGNGVLTYHRPSVLMMTSDLIGTIATADVMIGVARLEARRHHDAARKMVRPIILERQAERQRRKRAAETPEERAARLARMAERRRERLAAETPDERAARLEKQRAAVKARRAARKEA